MRAILQALGFTLASLLRFVIISTFLKRRYPSLSDNARGTISWILALIVAILLALLMYPHGWT